MSRRDPLLVPRMAEHSTSIFGEMSALAARVGAINLGQGFPDTDGPQELKIVAETAIDEGRGNQYPPAHGLLELREAIAFHQERFYGIHLNPVTDVVVTTGASEALQSALLALIEPGDEVVMFEPWFDIYAAGISLARGTRVSVPLGGTDYRPDIDALRAAITPRARILLINSPHNPSGMIWSREDMLSLQDILAPTDIILISDEVYEHMVYAPNQHWSAAHFDGLAARAFIVSSFGKTYHVTGWKVGTVAAPAALTAEFRKVHQFNVFTVNTPMQHALARYMADAKPYLELPAFYQRKRDLFRQGLAKTKFKLLPGEGTYFQCVDISELAVPEKNLSDADFCQWLTTDMGVAAIPLSAFYGNGFDQKVIRFCFAKQDATLLTALDRLAKL